MTTASTLQRARSGLINKNNVLPKRKIPQLFYSETTWKLSSSKELNEKEINEVIRRVGDFYTRFLKEKRKELESFGFELDFNKDSAEFKLKVKLSSADYIPTNSLAPPCIDLPLDQLSSETVNITHMSPKNKNNNNNGGPKNVPTTVTPTLQSITVKADDSAPTQNTGGQTPPPTKG